MTGSIDLELPGSSIDLLQAFRQSLQQYPDPPRRPGTEWTSSVHRALASESGLSDRMEIRVRYAADEVRGRERLALLTLDGEGPLPDGSGRLTMRSDTFVSLETGMPVEEQTHLRMESAALIIEGESSLIRIQSARQ